jgi:anti-sigma factor RsiW
MSTTSPESGRSEIEDLLPWYANGRLSPADRRRVEAALAEDAELARRLELVREEMIETIASNEALEPSSIRAFDRLMAGIDEMPAPRRRFLPAKAALVDRIGARIGALAPRRLAYAAAAVVAVIAVQAVVLGDLLGDRSGGGYRTASQEVTVAAGPSLLVAFTAGSTVETITALLKKNGAAIVEGPRANGFFRLRLPAGSDAAAIAGRMRAETAVVSFVEVVP